MITSQDDILETEDARTEYCLPTHARAKRKLLLILELVVGKISLVIPLYLSERAYF